MVMKEELIKKEKKRNYGSKKVLYYFEDVVFSRMRSFLKWQNVFSLDPISGVESFWKSWTWTGFFSLWIMSLPINVWNVIFFFLKLCHFFPDWRYFWNDKTCSGPFWVPNCFEKLNVHRICLGFIIFIGGTFYRIFCFFFLNLWNPNYFFFFLGFCFYDFRSTKSKNTCIRFRGRYCLVNVVRPKMVFLQRFPAKISFLRLSRQVETIL